MKKSIMFLIIGVFLCTGVLGAWYFSIHGGFTANVSSLRGYAGLELNIPTMKINTTNGADSNSSSVQFLLNKNMTLNISIKETYQDDSLGECLNGQNDCTMKFYLQNQSNSYVEITNGKIVNMSAMPFNRYLNATLSCEAYSCPQSRSAEITMTEVMK